MGGPLVGHKMLLLWVKLTCVEFDVQCRDEGNLKMAVGFSLATSVAITVSINVAPVY